MPDITPGAYVLATKYADGDPLDEWCVGFYHHYDLLSRRHYVVDDKGQQFRANGFRRAAVITRETGRQLLKCREGIEQSEASLWLWCRGTLSEKKKGKAMPDYGAMKGEYRITKDLTASIGHGGVVTLTSEFEEASLRVDPEEILPLVQFMVHLIQAATEA